MPNLYATTEAFRRRYVGTVPALDAEDQRELLRILDASSRAVESFCDRHFYAAIATRVFDGNGRDLILLPDLLAATTVKLDEDTDGTFELALTANTDYWLLRYGHWDQDGTPKTAIRLNTAKGSRSAFLELPRLLQIVGTWGYTQATEDTGATLNEALDTTETGIDVSSGPLIEVGDTLLVENEQMYVTEINADTLTVLRGVNGTTAATHLTALPISRYVYVPEVVEAVLIQAGRLWKRRETAYSTIIQNPGLGTLEVFKGLDPDVRQLLAPLRRIAV